MLRETVRCVGHLDIALKEFARYSLPQLVRWLCPDLQSISVIQMPEELPATLRRVDVLLKTIGRDDAARLQILECQVGRDAALPAAMLLRAVLTHVHYALPVQSLLLALTPQAVIEPIYTYGRCQERPLVHEVEVRHIYKEEAEAALDRGGEALLPLLPAMQPRDGDQERLLEQVIARIATSSYGHEHKQRMLSWAASFATLHLSRPQVQVIVDKTCRRNRYMLNALDLPLLREIFEEGHDKGLKEGHDKGLNKGLRKATQEALIDIHDNRLGPMPEDLRAALCQIEDIAVLRALIPLFLTASREEIASRLLPL